jgi:hypothetical protein
MTLRSLFSFFNSHQPCEKPEQGLLISSRLKELLESTERERTPYVNHTAYPSNAEQPLASDLSSPAKSLVQRSDAVSHTPAQP